MMQNQPQLTQDEIQRLKTKLEKEKAQTNIFPSGPFSPLHFRTLPAEYEIICTSKEQFEATEVLGSKLHKKHPSWTNERLMRKIFERFPSIKIQLKQKNEQSISGTGQENTSGDQE